MITISGQTISNTNEYTAALSLREKILHEYPQFETGTTESITIIVGAKCHGQTVRDIDLIVIGKFDVPFSIRPFLPFTTRSGDIARPDSVLLDSFCLVIEVKAHSAGRVRFTGSQAEVFYADRHEWHDASHQNEMQKQSLLNYLRLLGLSPVPWVTPLVWMVNIPEADLPRRPHNILGADARWSLFLNVIMQVSPPKQVQGKWRISANYSSDTSVSKVVQSLTKTIEPTPIDRRRMELINQRVADELNLQTIVGRKLLLLRGRGGSGKTMRLLQLAKRLYDDEAKRILILTYNRALVADLRRLLTIMGISDGVADRSIQIQTVQSFFYGVLQGLGIVSAEEDAFLEKYVEFKGEALQMLTLGVAQASDIDELMQSHRLKFSWDYVFVDEGQDFPDDERDILYHLYSTRKFAIADGVDQLIRSQVVADWRANVPDSEVHPVPLRTCLRMKSELTHFIGALAGEFGLQQAEWVANDHVPGGRIIIVEGAKALTEKSQFETWINQTRQAGNEPVDMLFCVPPSMIKQPSSEKEPVHSIIGQQFEDWGWKAWDGAAYAIRGTYPTDNNELRVVQYDSCRGLEGWTTVLLALDDFYRYKLNQLTVSAGSGDNPKIQAARWLMIPLTRAMDTLVIHITEQASPVRDALEAISAQFTDVVEWHKA